MAVLFGCGGDSDNDPTTEAAVLAGEIAVHADRPADDKTGKDLRAHLDRNCPSADSAVGEEPQTTPNVLVDATEAICRDTETISVADGQVTVQADLADDLDGKSLEVAFCSLIQGADVADFTKGHELQDIEGKTMVVCPARAG